MLSQHKDMLSLNETPDEKLVTRLDTLQKQIEQSIPFSNIVYNKLNLDNRKQLRRKLELSYYCSTKNPSVLYARMSSYFESLFKALDDIETPLETIFDTAKKAQPKLRQIVSEIYSKNKLQLWEYEYLQHRLATLEQMESIFTEAIATEKNKVTPAEKQTSIIDRTTTEQYALNQIFANSTILDKLLMIINEFFISQIPSCETYKSLLEEKIKNANSQNAELNQSISKYERLLKMHDANQNQTQHPIRVSSLAIIFYAKNRHSFENFREFIADNILPPPLQTSLVAVDIEGLLKIYIEKNKSLIHFIAEDKPVLEELFKPLSLYERFRDIGNFFSDRAMTEKRFTPLTIDEKLKFFTKDLSHDETIKKIFVLMFLSRTMMSFSWRREAIRSLLYFMINILHNSQNTPTYPFYLASMYSYLIYFFSNEIPTRYISDKPIAKEIIELYTHLSPPTEFESKSIAPKFKENTKNIKIKQHKYFEEFYAYLCNLFTLHDFQRGQISIASSKVLLLKKMAANEYFFKMLQTQPDITSDELRKNIDTLFGPEVFKSRSTLGRMDIHSTSRLNKMLKNVEKSQHAASLTSVSQKKASNKVMDSNKYLEISRSEASNVTNESDYFLLATPSTFGPGLFNENNFDDRLIKNTEQEPTLSTNTKKPS